MKRSNGEGTIFHEIRNGKKYYKGQVTIGYDKDGNRIRKTINGYDRGKVIKEIREIQVKNDQGLISNGGDIKFQDYFHSWIFNYKQLEVTESSFQSYEAEYRLRIENTKIGRMQLSKINTNLLQAYYKQLLHADSISLKTIKRLNMYVKACFNHAIEVDKILFHNPCVGIKLPAIRKSKNNKKDLKVFTDAEQKKIIGALDLSDTTQFLIFFGFATGVRIGEARGFQWDQWQDYEIYIDRQYRNVAVIEEDGTKHWKSEIYTPKTEESERWVPIGKFLQKELRKHKFRQNEIKLYMGEKYIDKEFVFADEYGKPINDKKINRTLRKICREVEVPELSFHALRHSFATRLFEKNVPVKIVSVILGHSSPEITYQTYTHVLEKSLEGIEDIIEESLVS